MSGVGHRNRGGILYRSVVVLLAAGTCAGLPGVCGVEKRGLVFDVSVEKQEFVSGEPVIVRFSWENKSGRPMSIREWGGPLVGVDIVDTNNDGAVYDFAVYRESGERLPYIGGWVDSLPGTMTLEPGQLVSRSYNVSQAYDLMRPGKYVLKAAYLRAVKPGPTEVRDYLVHPDVTIVIVEHE